MMCLHNDLTRALETLELRAASGQHDFLVMAALKTGGYFHDPDRANNWDSQMVEIKAHGIFASGADRNEAIRNWMLVAARQSRVLQQVALAEHLLCQPDCDVAPDQLRRACKTIIAEGRVQALRAAARETLANMQAAL
jgi:hypothetical protein